MSEEILFIELFQPFAQYRNPFTFYYAQTFPLPPKSTIIGMLQNAVGDWYGSNEGIENWWGLKVSVHGGFESVFWNYQLLIKGELAFTKEGVWVNRHDKNPGGNIWLPLYKEGLKAQRSDVHQQELFNGHLYIFIKGKTKEQIELLEKIKSSLENHIKILYLGRSEDVVFVKRVDFVKKNNIKTKEIRKSLWPTLPTYIKLKNFPILNQKFPIYHIPVEVRFKNKNGFVKHKAEIAKQTERKPKFESVIYSTPENSIYFDTKKTSIKYIRVKRIEIGNNLFKIPEQGWL